MSLNHLARRQAKTQSGTSANARPARESVLDRDSLSPDVVAELLDMDPATGRLFWKPRAEHWFRDRSTARWNTRYAGTEAFTATVRGHRVGYIFNRVYQAHRVVFAIAHGRWPNDLIDHADGNPGNNRPDNLREATPSQNSCNRRSAKGSSSRYLGVCRWRVGQWQANICHDRKMRSLGKFKTEEEAARAYDAAAIKFHGEFARLNFPAETVQRHVING